MNPHFGEHESGRVDRACAVQVLTVNGTAYEAGPEPTLSTIVSSWCGSPDGIAVALNSEVVPRSEWEQTLLHTGDRVEIVTAAAGG